MSTMTSACDDLVRVNFDSRALKPNIIAVPG